MFVSLKIFRFSYFNLMETLVVGSSSVKIENYRKSHPGNLLRRIVSKSRSQKCDGVSSENESAYSVQNGLTLAGLWPNLADSGDSSGSNRRATGSQLGSHGSYMNACVICWLKRSTIGPDGHVVQPRFVCGRYGGHRLMERMPFRPLLFFRCSLWRGQSSIIVNLFSFLFRLIKRFDLDRLISSHSLTLKWLQFSLYNFLFLMVSSNLSPAWICTI